MSDVKEAPSPPALLSSHGDAWTLTLGDALVDGLRRRLSAVVA
jgi:hypothetical protein